MPHANARAGILDCSAVGVEARREPGTVLLVDLSGIFWAAYHATVDQEVSAAFDATISTVARYADRYDHVAVCVDSPPYRRKQLLPTYKSQRDAPPEQALAQFARAKERLARDGHWLVGYPGEEADDVIATCARHAVEDGHAVVILSGDKDLLTLVDDEAGIRALSPRTGDTLDASAVEAKFGVPPARLTDLLALTGDKSDNVPGIPGVGTVRGSALLRQHGTLEDVLRDGPGTATPALRAALVEHADAARLARRVIALRDDCPIDWPAIYEERTPMPINEPTPTIPAEEGELESGPAAAPEPEPAPQPERPPSAPTPVQQTTALATTPADWERGLEPRHLGAAQAFAIAMANSRMYSRFPTAEAILAVIVRGRELGLGAMTALDTFHVVEGKPVPHAHLIIARAEADADCEYFSLVESSDERATYTTKHRRHPTPTTLTYTIAQARLAGRAPEVPRTVRPSGKDKEGRPVKDDRSQWEKMPAEMLRKTCAVQLARIVYPAAALGLYAVEELDS